MRTFLLALASALLLALVTQPLANAETGKRSSGRSLVRSQRGFARDLKRIARVPRVSSLSKLLDGGSRLGGRLMAKGSVPWRWFGEGRKTFTVDLGDGCKIQGTAHQVKLPMIKVNKLVDLKIVKGDRTFPLMPKGKLPVLLDYETSFYYEPSPKVQWHGPESRFAMLSLFHELGHAKDHSRMSDKKRATLEGIYNLTLDQKPLTSEQHRTLVGFERSAWAHALRKARTLKQHGVDLFGGASNKEVMTAVYGCLKGYYEYQGTQK